MNTLIYNPKPYKITRFCMEIYKELGKGFFKIVYGDILEIKAIELLESKTNSKLFSHFKNKIKAISKFWRR